LEDIKIVASRSGRISLAINKMKNNQTLARQVEDRFGAISGIRQVETDVIRGLVSIDFD
jgi:hypothetical protein